MVLRWSHICRRAGSFVKDGRGKVFGLDVAGPCCQNSRRQTSLCNNGVSSRMAEKIAQTATASEGEGVLACSRWSGQFVV